MNDTAKPKNAPWIQRIEIWGLWGKYDIKWELDPRVNILIGINGSGKSTILRGLARSLKGAGGAHVNCIDAVLSDGSKAGYLPSPNGSHPVPLKSRTVDYISTFDTLIRSMDKVKIYIRDIATELDAELFELINGYHRYQVKLSKRVEKLFLQSDQIDAKKRRDEIFGKKNLFTQNINRLFSQTNKVMDSDEEERVIFRQGDTTLTPYQLSAGEKQLLLILLKVLLQDNKPALLIMDEPEISMHLEWQEQLIDMILQLNENVQLIIATHSPAIMMKGWLDKATEMHEISKSRERYSTESSNLIPIHERL